MDSIKEVKEEWLKSFQGATLILEPKFGSPKVNHIFQRSFDYMGRNAFFVSVRGRILLGEDQVSMAEQHIYNSIEEMTKAIDRQIEAAKAVVLDAGISIMAQFNKPVEHKAVVISPIQTRYIKLLEKADELFMYINTLMLHGEMSEREHSKRELQIKHHMRTIPSTVRKVTIGLRNRLTAMQEKEAQKPASDVSKPADPVKSSVQDDGDLPSDIVAKEAKKALAAAKKAAAAEKKNQPEATGESVADENPAKELVA